MNDIVSSVPDRVVEGRPHESNEEESEIYDSKVEKVEPKKRGIFFPSFSCMLHFLCFKEMVSIIWKQLYTN